MRLRNVWFDMPSALVGSAFLIVGLLLLRECLFGEDQPLAGRFLAVVFFLILGGAFLWMSISVGRMHKKLHEHKRRKSET